MARIDIIDDFGKRRGSIDIDSADASDLKRIVEEALEESDTFRQCETCDKWFDEGTIESGESSCSKCIADVAAADADYDIPSSQRA